MKSAAPNSLGLGTASLLGSLTEGSGLSSNAAGFCWMYCIVSKACKGKDTCSCWQVRPSFDGRALAWIFPIVSTSSAPLRFVAKKERWPYKVNGSTRTALQGAQVKGAPRLAHPQLTTSTLPWYQGTPEDRQHSSQPVAIRPCVDHKLHAFIGHGSKVWDRPRCRSSECWSNAALERCPSRRRTWRTKSRAQGSNLASRFMAFSGLSATPAWKTSSLENSSKTASKVAVGARTAISSLSLP